jgi:aldehyde:ferredoxin oxidoreductase
MKGGYCGKVLRVNLSAGRVAAEALDPDWARKFIGDFGINLRMAYEYIPAGIDPLSPENVIIFGAGPLVGAGVQASRWTVATKLPLTGAIACCSAGMGLGVRMKRAGYDHVVITGRSSRPVYLYISDDSAEIREAEDLWGRDIYDTTDALRDRLGKDLSVAAIGQAGENLVRLAFMLVDRNSSLGKGGLAAVMASKNLKAVAVKGTGKVPIADKNRWAEASSRILKLYKNDPKREDWKKFGKMIGFGTLVKLGAPYKNWAEVYPREQAEERFGFAAYSCHLKKRTGCTSCSNACKEVFEVKEGEYAGLTTNNCSISGRPVDLGLRFCLESYDQFIKLLDVCNRYGICTQAFTPLADLAIDLYEKGIITDKDTGGIVLKRDFNTALTLVKMTTFREGFGDVLADGTYGLIRRFGSDVEKYSMHIKGIDQQQDPRPRQFTVSGFSQVTNPEGGNIETGIVGHNWYPGRDGFSTSEIDKYCRRMDIPEDSIKRIFDVETYFNVGRLLRHVEDYFVLFNSMGICAYRHTFFDWASLAALYSAATGIEVTREDMKQAGERIWNMYKAVNVREGFDRKDDRIPPRWLEPLKTEEGEEVPLRDCGNKVVTMETMTKLLDDYYDERGYDVRKGIPKNEQLIALGMDDIAADLGRRGIL